MRAKGPLLLLVTAVLWGMAFVAQTSASSDVSPFTFNASRNIVGVAFLSCVIAVRKRLGHDRPAGTEPGYYSKRTLWTAGIACGVVLCAASFLQQWGITSYPPEAAAAGRSGFITATYMIMVALAGIALGSRPHPLVFVAVALAVVGMYFLCVPNGLGSLYFGDVVTLLCAVGYAAHVLIIDRFTGLDGVRLSRMQLLTSFAISAVGALLFEQPDPAAIAAALVPILYAGICSDGIAYTLQIIAQKTTDATVASIIMSLESVFAALGGWLILSETLSPIELFGCALVFAAVMLAQTPEFMRHAAEKKRAAQR